MSSPGPEPQRFVIVPNRPHASRRWLWLALAWLASLAAVGYWASSRSGTGMPAIGTGMGGGTRALQAQIDDLRQQVATLKRSDQISRNANLDLQSTLADREEEISGLRADVDFYERLVGSTGQRHGLTVHQAVFAPEPGGTWHYTVTLTQNINRGAISKGTMRLAIEGVRAGKLTTVSWDELRQKPNAPGQPFSFRYFQQVEDTVMLPAGFTPQRVRVSLDAPGNPVDQSFPWTTAKNAGE